MGRTPSATQLHHMEPDRVSHLIVQTVSLDIV